MSMCILLIWWSESIVCCILKQMGISSQPWNNHTIESNFRPSIALGLEWHVTSSPPITVYASLSPYIGYCFAQIETLSVHDTAYIRYRLISTLFLSVCILSYEESGQLKNWKTVFTCQWLHSGIPRILRPSKFLLHLEWSFQPSGHSRCKLSPRQSAQWDGRYLRSVRSEVAGRSVALTVCHRWCAI
jgi:hypothetical protein